MGSIGGGFKEEGKMVEFNLYPWRKAYKQYQFKKLLGFFFLSFLVSMLLLVVLHWALQSNIESQTVKIGELENRLQEKLSTKTFSHASSLLNQALLQKIQKDRTVTYELLQSFFNSTTNEICFTQIKRDKNQVVLSGLARSTTDLTQFMREWLAVKLFLEIKLKHISQETSQWKFLFVARQGGDGYAA